MASIKIVFTPSSVQDIANDIYPLRACLCNSKVRSVATTKIDWNFLSDLGIRLRLRKGRLENLVTINGTPVVRAIEQAVVMNTSSPCF